MTGQKLQVGIRRKVIFQAWCHRCLFGWSGPERDQRSMAEFDRAGHEMSVHGGAGTRPASGETGR